MKENVNAFLIHLTSGGKTGQGFASNTIAAYRNDLFEMVNFVEQECNRRGLFPEWSNVSRDILLSYILGLKERHYMPATMARKISSPKSFFRYMVKEGKLATDPTDGLALPRVGRNLPQTLSISEVRRLLDEPANSSTAESRRDKAMLELLYATGMCVSELIALNVSSIDLKHSSVCCIGRGSRKRVIPIPRPVVRILEEYIEDSRIELLQDEQESLFLNWRGERLTRQGFWQILKGYAKAAGLNSDVTPNTLRHSFAAHMLSAGADLDSLKELLGHANISTTQMYTQLISTPLQYRREMNAKK